MNEMAFNEDQKATIREIAFEVGKAISQQIKEEWAKDLQLHQAQCPVKEIVNKYQNRAAGFVLAFTLLGSAIGALAVVIGKYLWAELTGHKP
jgi:SMC interacting uncharacterized protein involved in chromosome segregation